MTNFILRSGRFDYTKFVKEISSTLKPGDTISPRCVRETRRFGNTDPVEKAEKSLRMVFDLLLGNTNKDFKRKRSPNGGYEYLRL